MDSKNKFQFKTSTVKQEAVETPHKPDLDEVAVKIAVKILKQLEGCNLIAYPDPESKLYKFLSQGSTLHKCMNGTITWKSLPDDILALSGSPWTIGFGETNGITMNTAWTDEEALQALEKRVRIVMAKVLEDCPKLVLEHSERIAAITSMTYNIGNHAFATSTACRLVMQGRLHDVGDAMLMWNKPASLIKRRQIEVNLWNSVKG